MIPKKIRADTLLVAQGLAPSRERAQSLILAGSVFVGTQRIDKPSQLFSPDILLTLSGRDHPYVGRGGVKLKAALDHFQISVKDAVCLDVGASTGGFTDCLLRESAAKVHALDVGYGQLDWSLRQDPRVVVWERVNFRYFDPAELKDRIDFVVMDVSFISLKKMIPKAIEVFKSQKTNGILIALVKPQFEAARGDIGKKGVVRDPKIIQQCVDGIVNFCRMQGLEVGGTLPSPICGQEGNQEVLLVARHPMVRHLMARHVFGVARG